jgi:hypothetical protein
MARVLWSGGDVVVCRCVLELHAIAARRAEGGGEFAVAMTADERARFLQGIRADPKEYYKMLGTVNAEASDCSRPADRASIHDGIRGTVGFAKLSRMVFGVLEEWMEGQLRAQVASCEETGEDEEAMRWSTILARVLSDQGRHSDALAMDERVLEFFRRVLPENHPSIGEGRVGIGVACGVLIVEDVLLIVTCRHGHGQSCLVILQTREARGCAFDARKGAGVQAACAAREPS